MRKFKFRVAMLVILVSLVSATVSVIGYSSYRNARFTVDNLSGQILEQTSLRVDQHIDKLLTNAVVQDDLSRALIESGQLKADDFPRLVAYWREVIRVNPDVTSLFIGLEANGEGTGVSRLREGKLSVWESTKNAKTGRLDVREYWANDYPHTPNAVDFDKGAPDLRTRPWYAAVRRKGGPIWTETFRFLGVEGTHDIYGVTYAVPVHAADGKLVAVVEADFDLAGLSRFLKQIRVGRDGFAFVVELGADGSRRVVAHPNPEGLVRAVKDPGAKEDSELVPIAEIADGRVPAFMTQVPVRLADEEVNTLTPVRFTHEGVVYLGGYRRVTGAHVPRWLICMVIPEEDVLQRVHDSSRISGLFGVGILVIAVLLSLYVSAQVARPLERLAQETEAIGKLQIEAHPVVHSVVLEVDRLAVATEEMKTGLRSFQKYVPTDLVRALLASGQEAKLGGERRIVTVFFCDIANFTTIAESLSPEELVALLGEYLNAFSEEIVVSGGTVDKYIGDAVMAFWGAPAGDPQHALAACIAAVRCRERLKELNLHWQAAGKPVLSTRMGIHTGEVVVGNIGSAARLNYTVIGDNVNLASRIEGLNKHYGTDAIISESTYLAVQDTVVARPLDWVSVKGKKEAVLMYELLGLKQDGNNANEALAELHARALASYRRQEWAQALELFTQVLAQRPDDAPATRMIARCMSYRAQPPGAAWDGVHRMDSK